MPSAIRKEIIIVVTIVTFITSTHVTIFTLNGNIHSYIVLQEVLLLLLYYNYGVVLQGCEYVGFGFERWV